MHWINPARPLLPLPIDIHATCKWARSNIHHATISEFEDSSLGIDLSIHVHYGVVGVSLSQLLSHISRSAFLFKNAAILSMNFEECDVTKASREDDFKKSHAGEGLMIMMNDDEMKRYEGCCIKNLIIMRD